jgi:two-component system response regulator MtrA
MLCTQLRTLPFVERAAMLFLGKRPSAEAVAQALDCGGDDYLRQPFEPRELQARVRALTRRTIPKRTTTDVTLHLDSASHSVHIGSRCAQLTPTEFALLSYLCGNPSQLHSASSLLEALWRYSAGDGDTALVRNHIRNLRRKIEENPAHPRIIVSLHGRGYIVRAHAIHWN